MESAAADHSFHKASGYIADTDALFSSEAIAQLENAHHGCFAFLAFDGKADPIVAQYVAGGTLAADSGSRVMVLFTAQASVSTPRKLSLGMLNGAVVIDDGKHPAYDCVRKLLPTIPVPPLPAVVVFDRFTGGVEPVVIGIGDATTTVELRTRLQKVFGDAASQVRERASDTSRDFATRLSAALARDGIEYERSGATSVREWLTNLWQWARQNVSTVVSIVKLFA